MLQKLRANSDFKARYSLNIVNKENKIKMMGIIDLFTADEIRNNGRKVTADVSAISQIINRLSIRPATVSTSKK